jgi:methionyl-tRNA formyltransferase
VNCVFLGKHKRSAVGALEHLVTTGWTVQAVVAPPDAGDATDAQRLDLAAARHRLRLVDDADLYAAAADPGITDLDLAAVDVVLSFLYWKRIRRPLIELGSVGCLNFHPAPLPELRGLGGINVAIVEGWTEWGVSAHFVDDDFDTGDLVRVDRFPLDADRATALSLDLESQQRLLDLFRWTVDEISTGATLPRVAQGSGRYVDRDEFEALRRVAADDPPELTARRMRAFWYPPHDGATVDVGGRTVTLVDEALLRDVASAYRAAGLVP